MGDKVKYCIFTGGEITDYSVISVRYDDTVVCADSGIYHIQKLGITPDVVIGDFDSYSGNINFNCEIIKCQPEKDDTDTIMCVKYAISKGADQITIYGGLSGRLDHTFANLQTLRYCAERNVSAVIEDGFNRALIQSNGISEYERNDSMYFSIFALTDTVMIERLSGVKYPLEKYCLTANFPLGVSNEIIEQKAILKISEGYALIIFSKK